MDRVRNKSVKKMPPPYLKTHSFLVKLTPKKKRCRIINSLKDFNSFTLLWLSNFSIIAKKKAGFRIRIFLRIRIRAKIFMRIRIRILGVSGEGGWG